MSIRRVGFDADDTLWKSEDYRDAQVQFERIVAGYVDPGDVGDRPYAVEKRNLALFGYGVKGMTRRCWKRPWRSPTRVSAPPTCTASSNWAGPAAASGGADPRHPARAVAEIATEFPVVLVTRGRPVPPGSEGARIGLADAFGRIEIVSEKGRGHLCAPVPRIRGAAAGIPDDRKFAAFGHRAVLALGGWGVTCPTT